MGRRNIFDVLQENTDLTSEIDRIKNLFDSIDTIDENSVFSYTIYDFVDEYLFDMWKHRGHCLDADDFLRTLNYKSIVRDAPYKEDQLLLLIEITYNFWWLADNAIETNSYDLQRNNSFYLLKYIMDDVLARMNCRAYELPEEECVLIGENKAEVTAVAEIIEHSLVLPVLRYNHFALKGDIETKKGILLALGADLEAKRKKLEGVNKQLSSDIFYMLNNLNIRHNNIDAGQGKKYKPPVANMTPETLESWYDELYQMILLAYLLLDNEDRKVKISQLKTSMGDK